MAVLVAINGFRIDGIDLVAGAQQVVDEQPPIGFHCYQYLLRFGLMLGYDPMQTLQSLTVMKDPKRC
jgi:hypothetical protein